MENPVSNRSNFEIFPKDYIFPPDQRPGNKTIPLCNTVPVIDFAKVEGDDRIHVIPEIFKTSQEFGFFQVINHGILKTLIDGTMDLCNEFFDMPNENKASYYSEDPRRSCRLYTSSYNYANESVHFWRDNLTHHCHPLEQYKQLWPYKPTRYRELMGRYSAEVRKLSLRILNLISEGLGLEQGYSSCPDPSLSLGLHRYGDPNLFFNKAMFTVFKFSKMTTELVLGQLPTPLLSTLAINYKNQVNSLYFLVWLFWFGVLRLLILVCNIYKFSFIGYKQWETKKCGTQSSDECGLC